MISNTGGCFYGAVRYRFAGPLIWTAHCHCDSCRRQTASPMTTFFAVALDGFEWTGGETGRYRSSRGVLRRFCRNCGSPVSYENETAPGEIHLYAASLDDHADLLPQRHDFWDERVGWLTVSDKLPKE